MSDEGPRLVRRRGAEEPHSRPTSLDATRELGYFLEQAARDRAESLTKRVEGALPMKLRAFRWHHVLQLPTGSCRYEAIAGELYTTPLPSASHQLVSKRLEKALGHLLEESERGVVFHAPFGVEFPDSEEGVEPDILFVSRDRLNLFTDAGFVGPPDLVVEILSPSTARRDRKEKLELYRRQGVPEYWVVDPVGNAVEGWRFAEGPDPERFDVTLPVRVGDERVGTLDLARIFDPDLMTGSPDLPNGDER